MAKELAHARTITDPDRRDRAEAECGFAIDPLEYAAAAYAAERKARRAAAAAAAQQRGAKR